MLRPSLILSALSLAFIFGCSTNSVLVPEYMTVSPHMLVYAPPDSIHTVALTHSCTCPITWTILKDSSSWVSVVASATGDQSNFPITINRSLLTQDTSTAHLYITTGEYQTQSGHAFDTVTIKAIR